MVLKKKGFFFTFDALLASVILLGMLMIITKYYMSEHETTHISYVSQDLITSLNTIKIGEINNSWINTKIADGNITDTNLTINEQMGQFWAEGQENLTKRLCEEVTYGLIDENMGYSILIDNEWICGRAKTNDETIVSSRKMVSGIEKFKPVKGIVAQAHLTSIGSKKYSSYIYFGGFVGQGNITTFIDEIPSGATLQEMKIEVDSGTNFSLLINKQGCNGNFTPSKANMTASMWNISSCLASIIPGAKNNFTISFKGDQSDSYIGGGFIKITYLTNQMINGEISGTETKWLPEITGIVNLYDSIYIAGQLKNMTIKLHYYADLTNITNNTLYISIGSQRIFETENLYGEGMIILTDANISKIINYSGISLKTVPIRIGFENVTFGYTYIGTADVAVLTDVSGSMDYRMDNDNTGTRANCNDPLINSSGVTRLSVAKCLDKKFAEDVINITGNNIGLVSYSTSTSNTKYPTANITSIYNTIGTSVPQTGYTASGSTCVCCGINSAVDMLMTNITRTVIIANSSNGWMYTTKYISSEPPNDTNNNTWYNYSYNYENNWTSGGITIPGLTNNYNYSPYVITNIGGNSTGNTTYADLWENWNDTPGPPNDFSSGVLNSTGNTYGINGANDGWDWDTVNGSGPFGYDDDINYTFVVKGKLEFNDGTGNPVQNRCSNYDCSGAYGISINITPNMYKIINSSNGSAYVSFYYEWGDKTPNAFSTNDEIWIKARWTSNKSGQHYLGTQQDTSHTNGDSDIEVAAEDNPNTNFSGYFSQELKPWIEGPGTYYLELGGKIYSSANNQYGAWRFDNIQIQITNATNQYYFRKHFNITNTSKVQRAALNILSDDYATIYINGFLIDNDKTIHDGTYWNRGGKDIPSTYLRSGDNVIAAELVNHNLAAKFDIELLGFDNPRDKAITIMTDGVANVECSRQSTGDPLQDAILAACQARQKYGITVYSVGFSDASDETTLKAIADCGDGKYIKSSNVTELESFYQDVASSIVAASKHSQTIEIRGSMKDTKLYGDSYIQMNYTPSVNPPEFGEITLNLEQNHFQNCSFNVTIPPDIRVLDSKITSYSSEHWTDGLTVNNKPVYNLSSYNMDYTELGDPFIVNIPPSALNPGENLFYIRTGDNSGNSTGCSLNDTFIYTGAVQANVPYSPVLAEAIGCKWNIQFNDNSTDWIKAPYNYGGTKTCSFTSNNVSYSTNDTMDVATFQLLNQLDFDDDYKIDIKFSDMNLVIQSFLVPGVPSMWGPAIAEARIW